MKITLRKRDSVVSAVLFIFNIYREYKRDCSIRLGDLLEMLLRFDKSEASIRTGLSRMVKSGILTNSKVDNQTIYTLTDEGIDNIDLWNRGLSRFFARYECRHTGWDGQWSLLTITDFNKSDYENQPILDELLDFGLREIGNVLWAAPYPIANEVAALIESRGFHFIRIHGSLSPGMAVSEWLDDIFSLTMLRQKYAVFLGKTEGIPAKAASLPGGDLLPVLFEAGWDFYDIVTSDPALPKELLPEWEGDKAVMQMKNVRPVLYQKITRYFEEKNI